MKRGKKGLVLAGALLLTMFALTGCGKTKINLNDYVEVNFSGYNTAGQAEINELKIRNDMGMPLHCNGTCRKRNWMSLRKK